MHFHPEDPQLTAWLLGELPAADAAAIERAVAADPALRIAVAEIEKIQHLLVDTLSPGALALLPRQRDQILNAARQADSAASGTPTPLARARSIPWLFPLATAAVLALAVLMLVKLPATDPGTTVSTDRSPAADDGLLPMEVALLPAPSPPDFSQRAATGPRPAASNAGRSQAAAAQAKALAGDRDSFLRQVADRLAEAPVPVAGELPKLVRRGTINAVEHPELPLPVHAGRASLGWITRAIRGDGQFPPADAVRTEEILNHFALRPAGPAAVKLGVTLSAEVIACPWKPSSSLVLVTFRGAADSPAEVAATFRANPAAIRSYRLLGFAPVSGIQHAQLPGLLPARGLTSLALEIDSASPIGHLGTINWTVGGQPAPELRLNRQSDAEPSDDARFAALVCAYSHWLAGEDPVLIDSDLLAALARECATDTLPADRADFLTLIDQSLRLRP